MTRTTNPGPAGRRRIARRGQPLGITGIAAGGAGVGRLDDGRVAFVPRTAPGEQIEVEILEERARWVRGRVIRVLEPAAERRNAPCPYYSRCGGCTVQHLEYPAQLTAKAAIVAEAIRRIGGTHTETPVVEASPSEFQYRNRLAFTLLRLGSRRVVAGFHELDAPARVLDIDHRCLLPEPALARAWRALRDGWGENASRLPAGQTIRLILRTTLTGEISLLVEGGYGDGRPDELLQRVPSIHAVWRRPAEGSPVLLAGAPVLREMWEEERIDLSGGTFLQVNRGAARIMERHVLALAGDVESLRVIDAYCGVGLYARHLAVRSAWVTGIELDPQAVAEARRACGNAAEFLTGRVEDRIAGLLPADLVIVNPPRAGIDAGVTGALLEQPPGRVIYVSCDPATLARDVSRLAGRYELSGLRCFDLFPQTAHVETVAELRCATS